MFFHVLRLTIVLFCFLTLTTKVTVAQETEPKVVQFSGVVVQSDNIQPIPFTSIIIKGTNRGTISDYYGFFSFVAKMGDIIEFSAVGLKKSQFKIPDTLSTSRYSLIQLMHTDTVKLKETVIFPWPTYEQFKQAFVKIPVPDDDYERAKRNIALAEMHESINPSPMSAAGNYKNFMQQQTSRLYYAGQYPPNNLLNPIAWAKFIDAWRNGDLKIQKN